MLGAGFLLDPNSFMVVIENIKMHIRHALLHEFLDSNTNATRVTEKIKKIYGSDVFTVRTCQYWFSRFKSGNYRLKNATKHVEHRSRFDNNKLISVLNENSEVTVKQLSQKLNEPSSTVHRHLRKLGKIPKLGQVVPHLLTTEHKRKRISICLRLLYSQQFEKPFLENVVTGDEKWIFL
jgi:HTH domain in Mos1 transposase/Winged helix-turn-helix DNA-binding